MPAIPKPVRQPDPARRAFARSLGCLVAGRVNACRGGIEAHHVIFKGQGGKGTKVSDFQTVGLCQGHHELARRRQWFEASYGIDFRYELERINKLYIQHDQVKPAPLRKVSPQPTSHSRVQHLAVKCECSQVHRVPCAKADITTNAFGHGVRYYCVRLKKYVNAKWKRAA